MHIENAHRNKFLMVVFFILFLWTRLLLLCSMSCYIACVVV